MSPESVHVDSQRLERLAGHGQEHLLRFWSELDPACASSSREIDALDLDRLDGLIETLVKRDSTERLDPTRVQAVDVVACRAPTASALCADAPPNEERIAWPTARSRSSLSPEGRDSARLRRPERDVSDRPGLQRQPVSNPRREGRRAWATPRPSDPFLRHDQPRESRGDRSFFRRTRRLRPRPRPLFHPRQYARRRSRHGENPPGRQRLDRPQSRRPRRHDPRACET